MSTSWMNIDQGFPTFTGQESEKQQIAALHNYLYQLREGLQYSLQNLSVRNFNANAWESLKNDQAQSIAKDMETMSRQVNAARQESSRALTEIQGIHEILRSVSEGLNKVLSVLYVGDDGVAVLGGTEGNVQVDADGNVSVGGENVHVQILGTVTVNGSVLNTQEHSGEDPNGQEEQT